MPDLTNLQEMQVLNVKLQFIRWHLTNLKELLRLYHNSLRGEIPWQIGLLTNLVFLTLNDSM